MAEKFPVGSTAYTKEGRAYTVEEVGGGVVYCSLPNGTETDFPEDALMSEQEWAGRSGGQDDVIYGRIKRAKIYTTANKLNQASAEKVLSRADGLFPGLLDFTAFTIGERSLVESGHSEHVESLSIIKCRSVFDEHPADIRVSALANILGAKADVLVSVADHGDNLILAMIQKGMGVHNATFEEFCDRPRR